MSPKTIAPAKPQLPDWFQTWLQSFEAAETCVFGLHNCIFDYVRPGQPVATWLAKSALPRVFETIVVFSIDQGLTFPQPNMRKRFLEIMSAEESLQAAGDGPMLMAPGPAIDLLLRFLKTATKQSAAVIVERLDLIIPNADKASLAPERLELIAMLHRSGTDPALETRGNALIMLTPSLEEVHVDVRSSSSGIRWIEVPLPDYDARLEFINQRIAAEADVELVGITPHALASLTAGLHRRHIEDVFLRARGTGKLTRDLARQRQRELMDLEYREVMARLEKPFTLTDVGGHEEAKSYFRNRVIKPLRNGDTESAPQNVLLVGPPGTGKTLLANAVANESGLNCLTVDLSKLLGGIVGQTEQNFAKLKRGIIANAPVLVVMDEIDQKVRRGGGGADAGGGGAVENRMFSNILEFFGDPEFKGKVMGLFMSNRPDLLDAAFISRMQAIIPILPPEDDHARAGVLAAIYHRRGRPYSNTHPILLAAASQIVDWSGRDVDQVIDEALAYERLEGMTADNALSEAIKYRRPSTRDVQEQVKQALRACNNLRLMPERYRAIVEQMQQKPATNGQPDDVEPEARKRRVVDSEWG